jgi:hypothetical protein
MFVTHRITRWSIVAATSVIATALPSAAEAGRHRYVGIHPVAVGVGGGFCYIESPHVHVYAPDHRATLYREYQGGYFFVGDPVAYGYDGPKHTYYGHHPISVDVAIGRNHDPDHVEYCYLDGPHYHGWTPPSEISFEVKGGAYWYVGAYPDDYRRHRKTRGRINKVYAGLTYAEPVVVVEPPAAYVGPVVGVHAGVSAGVRAEVVVPSPVVEVDVGFPWLVVDAHPHHHHHDVVVVDGHRHWKHKKFRGHRGKYKRHRGHVRYRRSGRRHRD